MSALRPDRNRITEGLTQLAFDALFHDGGDPANDLGGRQTMTDYQSRENQRQYVHMYFAKHIAAWSGIRATLGWEPSPLESIGAGPWLDAMGWCWERQWSAPITLTDPLPWEAVTSVPAWFDLAQHLMPQMRPQSGRFVPDGAMPSQMRTLHNLSPRPMSAEEVPEGATVLMPFVLNHFTDGGRRLEAAPAAALTNWLERAKARGCRIIVADMYGNLDQLWQPFLQALGLSCRHAPGFLFADRLEALAPFYNPDCREYRTYRRCRTNAQIRVLVWDTRWYFLE